MKPSILIIILIILVKTGFAQQDSTIVKYSFKGKKDPSVELKIYSASIYIQGYDGDELIIEPYNPPLNWRISEEPFIKKNAKWVDNIKLRASRGKLGDDGLKDITPMTKNDPIYDNSFGKPVIKEYPQQVQISMQDIQHKALLIKLPRDIHLKLSAGFMQREIRMISLKDLTGELEIKGAAVLTELDNVTGPLTLSSDAMTSSKIIITHVKWYNSDTNPKKTSLFISSNAADIDISVPENIKATVNINTTNGEIYSDLNMVPKYPASNIPNNFSGDLNGGGTPITIGTNYGNVFLRKQK